MGAFREPSQPPCLPGAPIQDKWVDGILHFERVCQNVRRYVFYRNRVSPDGIPYREIVDSFLCNTSAIMTMIRQVEGSVPDEIRIQSVN